MPQRPYDRTDKHGRKYRLVSRMVRPPLFEPVAARGSWVVKWMNEDITSKRYSGGTPGLEEATYRREYEDGTWR